MAYRRQRLSRYSRPYVILIDDDQTPLQGSAPAEPNADGSTLATDSDGEPQGDDIGKAFTARVEGPDFTHDFGFVETRVGNLVWRDSNADGVQDANEPAIADVVVNVYAVGGSTVLATTTTSPNGLWTLGSLTDDLAAYWCLAASWRFAWRSTWACWMAWSRR